MLFKELKEKRKQAREMYQDLSEEEKNKKRQCRCELYNNLSEDDKQKLVECKKIIKQGKIKILQKYRLTNILLT